VVDNGSTDDTRQTVSRRHLFFGERRPVGRDLERRLRSLDDSI
jgi:hypothetical protein